MKQELKTAISELKFYAKQENNFTARSKPYILGQIIDNLTRYYNALVDECRLSMGLPIDVDKPTQTNDDIEYFFDSSEF